MSRYEFHPDGNSEQIDAALEAAGAKVWPLDKAGDGVPDRLVGFRRRFFLLEIKNPSTENRRKPRKALRPDQRDFFDFFAGYPVFVVFTPRQALRAIGART